MGKIVARPALPHVAWSDSGSKRDGNGRIHLFNFHQSQNELFCFVRRLQRHRYFISYLSKDPLCLPLSDTHTLLWSELRCGLIHEPGWPCVIGFHRGIGKGVSWVPGSFPGGYAAWTPTHYRYPYVSEMNTPSDPHGLGLHLGSTDNATLISTVVYIVWPNCAPSELLPPTLLAWAESYGNVVRCNRHCVCGPASGVVTVLEENCNKMDGIKDQVKIDYIVTQETMCTCQIPWLLNYFITVN